jgi:hypothetical protein
MQARPMRSEVKPHIVYYAFGGGMGHATRAAAILRQLRRWGCDDFLALTNARLPLPFERENIPFQHFTDCAPDALRAQVPQAIAELAPQVLVVDVFPCGIVGELTDILSSLPCRKSLVYRHLQEPFAAKMRDALSHFDCVLLAEPPPTPLPCPVVDCCPILLRNADELLPRAEAKARLGAAEHETVVLGVSSDDAAWTQDFFDLLRKIWEQLKPQAQLRLATVAGLAPASKRETDDSVEATQRLRRISRLEAGASPAALRTDHYPLIELFNGVEVVVGASGYNLFHEAQACGVEAIFLPQPRRYDDQFWRARNASVAGSPEELERLLREKLELCRTKERSEARFENGASGAARTIIS